VDTLQRARGGDQQAFAELFEAERLKLLRIAVVILKDDAAAEDAVSDAYLKASRGIGNFDPSGGSITAWLSKIVKNASIDASRRESRWTSLDGIGKGTPTREERDGIPNAIISKEDERLHAEAIWEARANFLDAARQEIRKWTDPGRRKHGLRIASDRRVESFLDALLASGGKVNQSHFVLTVMWAADCAKPWKEPFTSEDARAAVKVLEYYGRIFADAPDGSGLEAMPANIETLLRMVRPVAGRRGTKTVIHQYDLITRLDSLFRKMCGPRRPADKAIQILLEITYGGKWTPGKLTRMKTRAREVFPT